MIWVSMLSAEVVFAVVATATPPLDAVGPETYLPLAAAALPPAALSIAWGRVVSTGAPAQSKWIVRWAMAEAVGLFGLVLVKIGGPIALAAPLFALSGLLTAVQFPRDEG